MTVEYCDPHAVYVISSARTLDPPCDSAFDDRDKLGVLLRTKPGHLNDSMARRDVNGAFAPPDDHSLASRSFRFRGSARFMYPALVEAWLAGIGFGLSTQPLYEHAYVRISLRLQPLAAATPLSAQRCPHKLLLPRHESWTCHLVVSSTGQHYGAARKARMRGMVPVAIPSRSYHRQWPLFWTSQESDRSPMEMSGQIRADINQCRLSPHPCHASI